MIVVTDKRTTETTTPATLLTRIPELRRRLLERRRAVLRRVARTEDEIRRLDAYVAAEPEEEAQETSAADVLARLDDHERASVAAIDAALARIAGGVYGRCRACHAAIPPARLEALPEADTCVHCAERPAGPPPR